MTILLCNGKGGTGKTTLAVLLAHALAEAGKTVAVEDHDPQGTATRWLKECDGGKVGIYDKAGKYDAVFVDTPPRLDTLTAALGQCSVAVIVCSPSERRRYPLTWPRPWPQSRQRTAAAAPAGSRTARTLAHFSTIKNARRFDMSDSTMLGYGSLRRRNAFNRVILD